MGYYTCMGDDWPPGKIPRCKYCRNVATWELWTHDGKVLLCDNARCHTAYIEDEGYGIDHIEGPVQWRRCKDCGKMRVFVDEASDQCTECSSENAETVSEEEIAEMEAWGDS